VQAASECAGRADPRCADEADVNVHPKRVGISRGSVGVWRLLNDAEGGHRSPGHLVDIVETEFVRCASGWFVSSNLSHDLPSATDGKAKFTTSKWALQTSSSGASEPRPTIPVSCARPSRSMPKQRAFASSQCPCVISAPVGHSQITSLTPISTLTIANKA
jgi:hypothetical protein